ncbi:hypothetical protein, partial [Pseudomonas viridiflava]|uniref:hypothetical protein n=1 Tax=Pseudomonas viridiflava TaxID=33069 RepID=UPI0019808C69
MNTSRFQKKQSGVFFEKTIAAKCHAIDSMAIHIASHWYEKRGCLFFFVAKSRVIGVSPSFKQEADRVCGVRGCLYPQIIHSENPSEKVSFFPTAEGSAHPIAYPG